MFIHGLYQSSFALFTVQNNPCVSCTRSKCNHSIHLLSDRSCSSPSPFWDNFFSDGRFHIYIPASPDDRVVELMYQYVPTANIQQKVIMSAFLHRVLRLSQQNSIWNWFKHRMTTSCSFLTSSVESLQNVNAARHRFLCHGSESGHWWH